MATLAELQTREAAIEAQLDVLYTGADFETSAGDGSRIVVKNTAQTIAALEKALVRVRRKIWIANGGKTVEPKRNGVDVRTRTSNGDGVFGG